VVSANVCEAGWNTWLKPVFALENKTILPQLKHPDLCIVFHFRLFSFDPKGLIYQRVVWNLDKCECFSSTVEHLSQLLAVEKKYFAGAKTVNSLHDVPTYTNFLSTSQSLYSKVSFENYQQQMFVKLR